MAIGAALILVEAPGKDTLHNDDVQTSSVRDVGGFLPNIRDCDGLPTMMKRLSKQRIQAIVAA